MSNDELEAEAIRARFNACAAAGKTDELIGALSSTAVEALLSDWPVWARDEQLPPAGDWTTWLILGGRGAGKTRAGAEWVRGMALGRPPFATSPAERIALVGETYADAREVMVEGVSGVLSISARWDRPSWQPSRRRVEWPNGSVAQLFSACDPESLRGPQFCAAWCDELAKWNMPDATWDMLQFGLRLGEKPRQLVTTTPRPVALLRRLIADPKTAVTRMSTVANAQNLAPDFLESVVARYKGTRLGRQELDGDLIEDRDDALWRRAALDAGRVQHEPSLTRLVIAVDPPASSGPKSDACGIVAVGLGEDGVAYVLADQTIGSATPQNWANKAVSLFHALEADKVVVEVNQGGEMVETVLRQADASVPVAPVRATRGKWTRAEPVALLYEQGRVRHVGTHAALEDEMCNFVPNGTSGGHSPDRIDALVWAVTDLMLTDRQRGKPRVRRLS